MVLKHNRLGDWFVPTFGRLADQARAHSSAARILAIAAIGIALALVWMLVYATNGTTNAFLHMMYVPIIAASLTLGLFGGVITAIAGGVLMGPLMPLNVELGVAQSLENTIYRAGFFVLIALTTGAFAAGSRQKHGLVLESRQRLSDMSASSLRLFARLVADRDEQTGGHCERVAQNSVVVGRAFGLDERELKILYWSGVLHDLGKLGVPEAILRKPGRLTSDEFTIIKTHPGFGERILLDISPSFAGIAKGVRSHHERWDGRGYPDGLAGEEIPLVGRILAVVDVFEAVTSHRPYREPMDLDAARSLIREGIDAHFDPQIARLFLQLERTGQITREAEPEPMYDEFATTIIEQAQRNPSLVN